MVSCQEGDICIFCKSLQRPATGTGIQDPGGHRYQPPGILTTFSAQLITSTLCAFWASLGDVKGTEQTFVHGNLGAARRCLVGGSQKGNQSSVNILHAITPCWTLPNTFMEALGKVFLYQHASSGHCYNDM